MAEHLQDFQQADTSLRDFASAHGVPESTLHDWNRRKQALDADPLTAAFLESPQLLHAIALAAHMVCSFHSHAGIRRITLFLELVGLALFLARARQAEAAARAELTLSNGGSSPQRRDEVTTWRRVRGHKDGLSPVQTCPSHVLPPYESL